MRSFASRSPEDELMDGDDVGEAEFAACVVDLAKVNTLTLARPPTLAFLDRALRGRDPEAEVTILDVGFGAGDMLRAIHRWAAKRGRAVRLIGIDLNPRSAPIAETLTPAGWAIEYRTGDLFALPDGEQVDIVLSSLVTHHMADDEIVRFLQWMTRRCRIGWFVNDLHRHWLPFYFFRTVTAITPWHPFVRHDGPVSIARAFRRQDWRRLIARAGLTTDEVRIAWRFPFRFCAAWLR
jgi:2-polyprenyl-3-methyl-5-hydroxy-6-metoxy-1,4-benzoquinol methylase